MTYTRAKRDENISLNAGCRVKHPIWGIGVVHECYGDGEDQKITVDFPNIGLKTLVVKFANLEKTTPETSDDIFLNIDDFEKHALKEPSSKKSIKPSCDEEFLNTPIEKLKLTVRSLNGLKILGLKTIKDIIDYGFDALIKKPRLGRKSIANIKDAILMIKTQTQSIYEISLKKQTFEGFKKPTFEKFKKPTFKELIKTNYDEKLLKMPIEELNLTVRSLNALKRAGYKTINDVVDFGLDALQKRSFKNCGKKSVANIKDAILKIQTQTHSMNDISFTEAIEGILVSLSPKQLKIIKARYGYDEGKPKILEEIGDKVGITRERVRQIIVNTIGRVRCNKKQVLQVLIEHIEGLLLRYKGIISINDLAKDEYFASGTRKQLRFLMNLIVDIFKERYRILYKYFVTSLDNDGIMALQSQIRESALKCQFPIDEAVFIEKIISSFGPISKDYLAWHLLYKEHVEILKGKVLSPGRLSIPQRVKLLMRDIDKPMHFTEIGKLYRNHFGNAKIKTSDLEHALHTRIADSKDFIIVNPGTFMLRNSFKTPDNIKEIVETSKEILQSLQSISDTKYLVNELKKHNIDIGNLNAYSLKTILLEYPGFVSYRKFEIGIEELADKYERKPLNDLIFEILSSTAKPMHSKTIWKQILKQRGFPKYAIEQWLVDDPRFIRVAPATYTVAKNIAQYEEQQKVIIDFAKEWTCLKGTAISAFFISEVLKETSEIKDISLGLVENVLSISPEFIRLPNRFYNLAHKETNLK